MTDYRNIILALPVSLAFAASASAADVVVFAAASMKSALDPIAEEFTARTGHQVLISYAGSNSLARQIIEGAPADIFISASTEWMDAVETSGEVVDGTRADLLGNTLVLIAADADAETVELDENSDFLGLLGDGKLAMALVNSVPAGQYGKASLTALGQWEKVEASVAQADNVRAALALVSTGEAPYGIVYATDAAAEPAVKVIGTFPAETHAPITYPIALLKNASDDADRVFFDALSDADAAGVFAAEGFSLLQ